MDTPTPVPTHLLVIDDDRPMQRMMADALTQQGFAVTLEQDGEWALKSFDARDFAAVVLDVHLPGISGYEVAKRLRASERGAAVPLIFVSGSYKTVHQQREVLERHGAVAFLEKPFKMGALYGALRRALGRAYPEPPDSEAAQSEDDGTEALADERAREEQSAVESASSTLSTPNTMRGDFRHQPFPEVLAEIHRWHGNGALLLRREKIKKIIYFRDGEPLLVKSNLLSECLGRVMVKERMISEAACEESLRRMKASRRQQGTVLIEMGCISPHNLAYALNLQLRAKLFEIFHWQQGEYQFNKRADLPSEPVNLEMSTALLIFEGVRRAYDAARLTAAMGNVAGQYVHPAAEPLYPFREIGLGEEERWVLEAVDGRKTVAALRGLELLPALDTDRLLYAMKCAHVVELRPTAAPIKLSSAAVFQPPPLGGGPPPLPIGRMKQSSVPWVGDTMPGLPGGAELPAEIWEEVPSIPPPPPKAALLEDGDDLATNDEETLRQRLTARLGQMRGQDYFELLGVPRDASIERIHAAHEELAREYDPERLRDVESVEVRQLASQIHDLVGYAHHTLSDEADRQRYQEELASGARPKEGEQMGSLLAAESKFQRGEELLERGAYDAAHQLFKEAVALYDQEGDFHAYLGWSRFKMAPSDAEATLEAIESLAKAISLNPRSEKGYLFTGYVYKATGRPEQAERQFEKAIQANPGCEEALQELRLLGGSRLGR